MSKEKHFQIDSAGLEQTTAQPLSELLSRRKQGLILRPKLLIVEDDESIRNQMKWALAQNYEIFIAGDREAAIATLKNERPSVIALDLGLPPLPMDVKEGFLTLAEIVEFDPTVKVVVITGQGEKENALRAISQGAYDFFSKPIQLDELKVVLNRAAYVSRIERDYRALEQQMQMDHTFEGMLGTSPQMQLVFNTIAKVAASDVPVLITGESGTGKEIAARAIHKRSSRSQGPFVVINCGAIPETLLESELFGHEKGSFTGAHIRRQGRVEKAQGGSLFLDEIGDLPLALQVKVLRFLQEQKIERIGGREEIFVDARVLAATNRDLTQAMKKGQFREDLYYRLGVITIPLPPLREREGDIVFIAKILLQKFARENRKKISGFSGQAVRALESHPWEGNIRELENRIKRAVVMAEEQKISVEDLDLIADPGGYIGKSLKEARDALEREFIDRALLKYKGNVSKVAEDLGVSRPTLYEMMGRLGVDKRRKDPS
jgi:two-component system, NtrC family, response regulator